MTGRSKALRALCHPTLDPPAYDSTCDQALESRRVSPTFKGGPRAAKRSGVFPHTADTMDAHYVATTQDVAMTLAESNLAHKEVTSYDPVNRELAPAMAQLSQAQTLRALGEASKADHMEREAEARCPGVADRFRIVGWPPVEAESLTTLSARLSGRPRYPLLA